MSVIVPAILTNDIKDFGEKLRMIDGFPSVSTVHVDFADNKFVPNLTILPDQLPTLPLKYQFCAHLMVADPQVYFPELQKKGFEVVGIHVESLPAGQTLAELLEVVKDFGFLPQLTINPRTPIEKIVPFLKTVDMVQIMTVEPGFYGSPYVSGDAKIKFLRSHDFYGTILVDGGIKKENAQSLLVAGADKLVVGSGIFKATDPLSAYTELLAAIGELPV